MIYFFITDSFLSVYSWVAYKSNFILLKVNSSYYTCIVKSFMLDSFSLNREFNLNMSSSLFIIYSSLEAYNVASSYWSCWICWDRDCSLFMAFLFVEFMSWLRRSFSLMSCLFCSINLFKEILTSFVLDKIKEMISVLVVSVERFNGPELLGLTYWWVLVFLITPVDDWFKIYAEGNWA